LEECKVPLYAYIALFKFDTFILKLITQNKNP